MTHNVRVCVIVLIRSNWMYKHNCSYISFTVNLTILTETYYLDCCVSKTLIFERITAKPTGGYGAQRNSRPVRRLVSGSVFPQSPPAQEMHLHNPGRLPHTRPPPPSMWAILPKNY